MCGTRLSLLRLDRGTTVDLRGPIPVHFSFGCRPTSVWSVEIGVAFLLFSSLLSVVRELVTKMPEPEPSGNRLRCFYQQKVTWLTLCSNSRTMWYPSNLSVGVCPIVANNFISSVVSRRSVDAVFFISCRVHNIAKYRPLLSLRRTPTVTWRCYNAIPLLFNGVVVRSTDRKFRIDEFNKLLFAEN